MVLGSIPVSLSVSTLIIELVIFLGMVWMLESFVFTPIRKAWAERDQRIQQGLLASNEGREEAEAARIEVQQILLEARRRAQGDIDFATTEGSKVRDDLVVQATAEFRRLVDEATVQITAERERTAGQLPDRIIDLVLLAASRVTGQTYSEPRVRELAATVVAREGLN